MILLEQYIELQIYHHNELRKYNVVELFKDDEGVIFRVFYKDEYVFTLIPTMQDALSFELSDTDRESGMPIEWDLYSKIEAALYSVFLKEPLS
ncbi:hypothetical protein [Ferruginibacter sp.]